MFRGDVKDKTEALLNSKKSVWGQKLEKRWKHYRIAKRELGLQMKRACEINNDKR